MSKEVSSADLDANREQQRSRAAEAIDNAARLQVTFSLKMMKFASKMMNFVFKMMNFRGCSARRRRSAPR